MEADFILCLRCNYGVSKVSGYFISVAFVMGFRVMLQGSTVAVQGSTVALR
jgi:hypothetical protein